MYQTFCKVFQSFEREPVTYVLSSLLKTLLVSYCAVFTDPRFSSILTESKK